MACVTSHDHDTALRLAADLTAAYPGLEQAVAKGVLVGSREHEVDAALIELSQICLGAVMGGRGPNPERVFAKAEQLIASSTAPAPVFEVLQDDDNVARVRTSSGKCYELKRKEGMWHRGHRVAATMQDAMIGAI